MSRGIPNTSMPVLDELDSTLARELPRQRERYSADEMDDMEGVVDFTQLRQGPLVASILETKSNREFEDAAQYEAFMAEPVVVQISDTSDKNAPPLVFVGVNGEGVWLPRNRKVRIPRRFVEILARSQAQRFQTRQNRDPNADNAMDTLRTNSQEYSFSVLHDPSTRGRAWLARVTREGC